jgi:EamA domain-containing membrane protein RarD
MSYVVSRRFFRERLTPIQFLAVISLTLSVAMVTMHSAVD